MTLSQFDRATEIQKELTHLKTLYADASNVIERTNKMQLNYPDIDPDNLAMAIDLVDCRQGKADVLCALSATYLIPADISVVEIVQAYLNRIADRILALEDEFDGL